MQRISCDFHTKIGCFCFCFDSFRVNVVQWSEDLYEKQLIERTIDACGGTVDIVIDYGTTSRSLHRSIQCLTKNGVVLVSEEVGERLLPKFSSLAEKREVKLRAVANGTIEQLTQLVQMVSKRDVSQFPFISQKQFILFTTILTNGTFYFLGRFLLISDCFLFFFCSLD